MNEPIETQNDTTAAAAMEAATEKSNPVRNTELGNGNDQIESAGV